MARIKDVIDECLTVSTAFVDISSDTYEELSAINWEDKDKDYPFMLIDKNFNVINNSYTREQLPREQTYTCQFYFMDTFDEFEKTSVTLQEKQDTLLTIADKYFAELKTRTDNGSKGFIVGDINFNAIDEQNNDRVIQLNYSVDFIVKREDCTTGTFNY